MGGSHAAQELCRSLKLRFLDWEGVMILRNYEIRNFTKI